MGYLAFSLVLASLRAFDELAYNSIFPMLLPEGAEQKGYAVASTLYPVLRVMMLPLSAVLLDAVGAAWLLVGQGVLSLMAAAVESGIRIHEERRPPEESSSLRAWWADVKEAARYLRQEKGLMNIYVYMAVTNGVGSGYSPILVAFFRTFPGMTAAMYSLFSVAEFLGRTVGGFVQYRMEIPEKKRYGFAFLVYMVYEAMDMLLLWLPYPLMLVNRAVCGFLGIQSATIRQAAVQRYIPDRLRARLNAYESMLCTAAGAVLSLAIGALGEVLDYRLCMTICGLIAMAVCWLTVFLRRRQVQLVLTDRPGETQPDTLS